MSNFLNFSVVAIGFFFAAKNRSLGRQASSQVGLQGTKAVLFGRLMFLIGGLSMVLVGVIYGASNW